MGRAAAKIIFSLNSVIGVIHHHKHRVLKVLYTSERDQSNGGLRLLNAAEYLNIEVMIFIDLFGGDPDEVNVSWLDRQSEILTRIQIRDGDTWSQGVLELVREWEQIETDFLDRAE
jgi:hypothetical protein